MKKRPVLIFGDKPGVVEAVVALGYRPVLVETSNPKGVADYIPLSEKEAFNGRLDLAKFQPVLNENLAGILPANEDSLIIASELRERFFPHLKGLTREQATIVRDKPLMKEKLNEAGIACAAFEYLQPSTTWGELTTALGATVLVKPRNQLSSRGMRVLRNEGDFQSWKRSVTEIDGYYVEQYLAGATEFFCNTIVREGEVVVQFTGSYDRNRLESNQGCDGHTVLYPALLTAEQDQELRRVALQFITAIGVRDGYCHAEIFLHEGRFKFGEMGVRLPGGWLLTSESFQCETSLAGLFARIFTESAPVAEDRVTVHHPYVGYYVAGKMLGQVRRLTVRALPGWIALSDVRVKEGYCITPENWESSRLAQLLFVADSKAELLERAALAATLIEVEIVPAELKRARV